jgi:hypothetical protein
MKSYRFTFSAGEAQTHSIVGTSLRVVSASASVFVDPGTGDKVELSPGMAVRYPDRFVQVHITSATAQTVEILAGLGAVDDSRLNFSGTMLTRETLPASLTSSSASVTTAGAQLLPASADRRSATIQADGGALYIGGPGVTSANGIKVNADGAIEIKSSGAIHAVTASGTATARILEELA